MVECKICDRMYEYNRKKGHTLGICNSCIVTRQRQERKRKCLDYKGGKCEKCGYDRCMRALVFHHLDPSQKDFPISGNQALREWDLILKELDKCVLLCSNCHMEVHDEEAEKRKSKQRQQQQQQRETHTVKQIEHGTSTSYSYHGCRCDVCKEHQKLKIRKQVAARKAKKITVL